MSELSKNIPTFSWEQIAWLKNVLDVPAKLGDNHDKLVWKAARRDAYLELEGIFNQQVKKQAAIPRNLQVRNDD